MQAVAAAAGLPSRLGKYELLLPLAAGGMARIYIGRSTGIGSFERHVVLKLITPERANDHTAVQMFLDEARLAACLNHQNVAQVFEVGEDLGIHYLAMEYVHGQDLRGVLAKAGSVGTRIPLELALTVVAGAAAGLNHAHERRSGDGTPLGIVHRDVTPSNIMIGYDGSVKLLDFGIAKATQRSVETQSGIIKGKFAYMAPEQCRGRDVDKRSDVFSLGIILYEITTQHRCFRADSDFDTMHRIVTGDVVRPTRIVQGYPQALEAIVMKALAIDAAQRYQSAGLLLEAIESFAVSARMSLSTMGLGRFMRDMFGEQVEPWVQSAMRAHQSQPVIAKESTISSTDGRSGAHDVHDALLTPTTMPPRHDEAVPDEEARFPDSGGVHAAKTVLDLPRDARDSDEDMRRADWNAKSYPSMPASNDVSPAEARQPYPNLPLPAARPTPPSGVLVQAPAGTTPPATVTPPSGQFHPTPGSGSGPSHSAINIPSTRHGYASGASTRSDLSYPRYEPPSDSLDDMHLRPNRRPLIIGSLVVIIGVAVILAVRFSGGDASDPNDNSVTPPQHGSDTAGSASGSAASITAPGPSAPPVDDMISIHIVSHPAGADVLIAGTKIGVTPLDKPLKRGMKLAQLTVHLGGYVDVNSKIDLGGDLSKDVILKPLVPVEAPETTKPAIKPDEAKSDEAKPDETKPDETKPDPKETKPADRKPVTTERKPTTVEHKPVTVEHKSTTPEHKPSNVIEHKPVGTPEHKVAPVKPKCDPPGQQNPFETICNGGPCPVCKT